MSIKAMNWAWSIKDLKPAEKLVLMKLADHANDDGLCWPGKSSIAEACNVSKRSADAHIQTLAAKGLITIHRRKSKDNDRLNDTNYYYLNLEQPELLSGADSAVVQKLQYGKKGQGGSAKIDKGGANSAPEPSVNHQLEPSDPNGSEAAPPSIWKKGQEIGVPRSVIGKWIRDHDERQVRECLEHLLEKQPADPVQYGTAWLQDRLRLPDNDHDLANFVRRHGLSDAQRGDTYQTWRARLRQEVARINQQGRAACA